MTGRLLIFGLGYTGRALGAALAAEGWRVTGTTRESGRAHDPPPGVALLSFDGRAPLADPSAIAEATHILLSVPPDDDGDPVYRLHGDEIAAAPALRWVGYLSTTGVYGTRDGGWVDEDSERRPTGARGARRAKAEDQWLGLWRDRGAPVHVFRLAGIYGPGRNQLETVRAGTAKRIDKPGQVFSRIHVHDIVRVLRASMERPNSGRVYNVCDDDPAPPAEVVAYAARLLGVAAPPLEPFEAADLSPMARSFYKDNKRVRNDRIKDELGVSLAYPSYRDGLRALVRETP